MDKMENISSKISCVSGNLLPQFVNFYTLINIFSSAQELYEQVPSHEGGGGGMSLI